MLLLDEEAPGLVAPGGWRRLQSEAAGYDAVVIGPGLGQQPATLRRTRSFLAATTTPTVVDADALNALAEQDSWWRSVPERLVLTPHPGEFGRLTRRAANDPLADDDDARMSRGSRRRAALAAGRGPEGREHDRRRCRRVPPPLEYRDSGACDRRDRATSSPGSPARCWRAVCRPSRRRAAPLPCTVPPASWPRTGWDGPGCWPATSRRSCPAPSSSCAAGDDRARSKAQPTSRVGRGRPRRDPAQPRRPPGHRRCVDERDRRGEGERLRPR